MSLNLHLEGGDFPYQTPTSVSRAAFEAGSGSALDCDLATVEYVRKIALASIPELTGKDARNPYLYVRRLGDLDHLNQRFDEVVRILKSRAPYAARQISLW